MQFDLNRFRDTFFQEADEHLVTMEAGLLRLEESGDDPELISSIFRCAHSIKGSSGAFGFDNITHLTHSLETLLDGMRDGKLEPTQPRLAVLLRSIDALRGLVEAARSGAAPPEGTDDLTAQAIAALGAALEPAGMAASPAAQQAAEASGPVAQPHVYRIRFAPDAHIFQTGMDPVLVLRELAQAGDILAVETELSGLPSLANLDPEVCYLSWTLRLASQQTPAQIRDHFAFVEDGARIGIEVEGDAQAARAAPQPVAAARGANREASSIRVDTAKVDRLVDLVGELVIAQSMATEIMNGFSNDRLPHLLQAFAEMQRYTRELQERVMSVRMLPIGSVFSRFPRLVHDLATSMGKQIALEMSGEETELDKGVVENMADPLTHLIRNAADHGIEPAEERIRIGKPAQGVIRLRAFHQEGNVVVEVTDDGRGLDQNRIRAKAIERGLIRESDELSAAALQGLIFEPGFSTATMVSDLSGRGVGMDVVKRNVEALNGGVSVSSESGQGSSVRVKLPLTLAILDGLLLKVGSETYVLPLVSILESIRPRREQLSSLAGEGEVVVVRGEPLPLLRLHSLFGIPNSVTDPTCGLVVLVESQGRRLALLVDELLGQQQVVVKSLQTHFRKVEGTMGATILGDGRPALILDAGGLSRMARGVPVAA